MKAVLPRAVRESSWRRLFERAKSRPHDAVLSKQQVAAYAAQYKAHPSWPLVEEAKQTSMLHYETLTLLHFFARRARSAILEIGAFTGTATAIMAAAAPPDVTIVTVEKGGPYNHPQLPSEDVLADLHKTLARKNVADRVSVIGGVSHDPETAEQVLQALKGRPIDLLLIDADGFVDRDMERFGSRLAYGCVLVMDDYISFEDTLPPEKAARVKLWVDEAIASGLVKDYGVYKWGTWFGQYLGNKPSRRARLWDGLKALWQPKDAAPQRS
jgi:predicted O-methyltransferase YrrM